MKENDIYEKRFWCKPWFYPLPVLIVGSYDENVKADAMNAAWGGLYQSNIGIYHRKNKFVNAPIINELPFTMECEYVRSTQEGNIIGKVININIDDSILDENGNVDFNKFKPIVFEPINNTYRVLGDVVGQAFSDGNKLK